MYYEIAASARESFMGPDSVTTLRWKTCSTGHQARDTGLTEPTGRSVDESAPLDQERPEWDFFWRECLMGCGGSFSAALPLLPICSISAIFF